MILSPTRNASGRTLYVLTVYGDESHDETRQRVFAVAGVLGSDADWEDVAARWTARAGGPVHATDLETRDAQHRDRTKHRDNLRLYADLVQIVAHSNLLCFASVMDLEAWRTVYPEPEAGADMPYYKCFSEVVIYFARIAKHSIKQEPVRFVFDRGEREYNAHQLYAYMLKTRDWPTNGYLADEIASASNATVGIQVADVIAREAMKHLDNQVGPVQRPVRRSIRELLNAHRIRCEYFTREYLEDERESLKQMGTVATHEGYVAWLNDRGLTDTLAHRLRYRTLLDDDEPRR